MLYYIIICIIISAFWTGVAFYFYALATACCSCTHSHAMDISIPSGFYQDLTACSCNHSHESHRLLISGCIRLEVEVYSLPQYADVASPHVASLQPVALGWCHLTSSEACMHTCSLTLPSSSFPSVYFSFRYINFIRIQRMH